MKMTHRQLAAMAALRISLGLLLVWWGLGRITSPELGLMMQEKFYYNLFPSRTLQIAFGYVEMCVGLLVVLGLFRKYAVPTQLLITGFSAATILTALLDPFGLWLPAEKIAPIQHLFYPSVISLAAGFLMYNLSAFDRYSLDWFLKSRGRSRSSAIAAE